MANTDITGPTIDDNFNTFDRTIGITEMLKKVSIAAAITGSAIMTAIVGGSASASFGDPLPLNAERVSAKETLASVYRDLTVSAGDENDKPDTRVTGADYSNLVIGPGDPRDEGDGGRVEDPGNVKIQAAPAPANLPNVSAGDESDKPSTRVADADYSNFIVGPGDPNEETGAQVPEGPSGGGSKVFSALPSMLPNVSAGDDNDKPTTRVANADYSKLIIGPGDPCEETGCPVQSRGPGLQAPIPPADGDDEDAVEQPDYSGLVIGPGDPCEETGCPEIRGFAGVQDRIAPLPQILSIVSAGNDASKRSNSSIENVKYIDFIVGPGDPRDEG